MIALYIDECLAFNKETCIFSAQQLQMPNIYNKMLIQFLLHLLITIKKNIIYVLVP